jgi:hypothetical protein
VSTRRVRVAVVVFYSSEMRQGWTLEAPCVNKIIHHGGSVTQIRVTSSTP